MTTQPDFDRFLLQGTASPEENGEAYAGEFSFSAFKASLYSFCRRAWYFHYLFAQGGWNSFADEFRRQAYKEKFLVSFSSFLSFVVQESLRKSLPEIREEKTSEREKALLEAMKVHASRLLFLAGSFLREGGMEKDPRKLAFYDLCYPTGKFENYEDLLECAVSRLRQFFHVFPESGFFRLLAGISSPCWRYGEDFPSFSLEGVSVFLSPCLYALSGGVLHSFRVFFHAPGKGEEESFADRIFALYAAGRYPGHKGKVNVLFFPEKEAFAEERSFFPTPADKEEILAKAEEILNALRTPVMENFPCTQEKEKCVSCRFKGICGRMGEGD